MVSKIALVVICVALAHELAAAGAIDKATVFAQEIYGPKDGVVAYAVVDSKFLEQHGYGDLSRRSFRYAGRLAGVLEPFFKDSMAQDYFRAEERWGYPMLYLRGRDFLAASVRLAHLGAEVRHELAGMISHDPCLARVAVYRNGERYFSAAFELAKSLEAYEDVDHFRIRSTPNDDVLGTPHGGAVSRPSPAVGFYEDSVKCMVVYPAISNHQYLADIEFSYYKALR